MQLFLLSAAESHLYLKYRFEIASVDYYRCTTIYPYFFNW